RGDRHRARPARAAKRQSIGARRRQGQRGRGRRAGPAGHAARLWYRPPGDAPPPPPRPQTPLESRTRFPEPRSRSAVRAWFGGGRLVFDRLSDLAGPTFRWRLSPEGETGPPAARYLATTDAMPDGDGDMPSVHRTARRRLRLRCNVAAVA